jgi:hypothetical protein
MPCVSTWQEGTVVSISSMQQLPTRRLPYSTESHRKLDYLHSHRQENHILPQFRCYFPTTHFMLLDIANGFKAVGLQTKNLGTFILSALGRYQPLIQWITETLPPRQADGIVKLHTHLHLVQQGWPTCSPQKKAFAALGHLNSSIIQIVYKQRCSS